MEHRYCLLYFGHQNIIATSSNMIFFIHQWIFPIGYLLREMTVKHTKGSLSLWTTTVKVSRVMAPILVFMTTTKKRKKKQQQQQNGSKSTNQYPNLIEVNVCFLEGPLLWFMGRIRVLLAGAVYTRPFL